MMSKAKLISILSNLAILANLVVGFLQVHWAVIAVFIVIHAVLRLAYVKAENELATHDNITQTSIAPPVVKNIASVITAVVLAVVVYFIGYGVAYFIK